MLHFFYPLYSYLDLRQGVNWWLPQWNMLDRIGTPIIGEPTSGIFYPLRWILGLPFFSIEQRIAYFLAVHFLIGWSSVFIVGRRSFRLSTSVASLVAIGYTFGQANCFLIYNPPYFFSSAWLPLALGSIFTGLKSPAQQCVLPKWGLTLAASLTLMILGGDVQLPYNLALLSFVLWLTFCIEQIVKTRRQSRAFRTPWDSFVSQSLTRIFQFGIAFIVAGALSALQILPTWYWMHAGAAGSETLLRSGVGDRYVLQSSELLTIVLPSIFGSFAPNHTRWLAAFQPSFLWCPSLHVGVLIIVCAALSLLVAGRALLCRTLLVIVVFAGWAALGDTAGLYWSLRQWFPIYEAFRFPMKFWPLVSLAICLLGGVFLDFAARRRNLRMYVRGGLLWLVLTNLVFTFVASILFLQGLGFEVPSEPLSGGFARDLMFWHAGFATSLTAIVGLAAWYILKPSNDRWRKRLVGYGLELLLLIQLLGLSNLNLSFADRESFALAPPADFRWDMGKQSLPVYFSQPGRDLDTEFESAPRSSIEVVNFQIAKQVGKTHLLSGTRNFNAQLSIEPPVYRNSGSRLSMLSHTTKPSEMATLWKIDCQDEQINLHSDSTAACELTLPMLQDGGWSIAKSSAGGPVELLISEDHLIRLRLPDNAGHVKLVYTTPGLKLGSIISVSTLLLLLIYLLCSKHYRSRHPIPF